jgi:ATP synthase protein I
VTAGESKPRAFFKAAQFASLGLEMGIAVAIGAGIGWWLDRELGTRPWLMLVFLMFGIAAGFKGVYAAAQRATRDAQKTSNERREDGNGA